MLEVFTTISIAEQDIAFLDDCYGYIKARTCILGKWHNCHKYQTEYKRRKEVMFIDVV